MIDSTNTPNPQTWSRVAGVGYLLIFATGIFAEFFVRGGIIVSGDPGATAANLAASESLFRAGLASEFAMLISDVVVAAALYVLLRPVSRGLALMAAFFRLAQGAVLGANLLNLWFPLVLLGGAPALASFTPEQLQSLALLFLETHGVGYTFGLVFFGAHCLVLGRLVLRSGYFPAILGVLLMIAGAGYLVDALGRALMAGYADYEAIFATVVFLPAFVGELAFCLWLLFRGVDVERWMEATEG